MPWPSWREHHGVVVEVDDVVLDRRRLAGELLEDELRDGAVDVALGRGRDADLAQATRAVRRDDPDPRVGQPDLVERGEGVEAVLLARPTRGRGPAGPSARTAPAPSRPCTSPARRRPCASTSAWAISPKRTATFSGSSGQTTGPMSWRSESPSNIRSVMPSNGWPTRAIRAVRRRRRTAAAVIDLAATLRRPSGSSQLRGDHREVAPGPEQDRGQLGHAGHPGVEHDDVEAVVLAEPADLLGVPDEDRARSCR